MTAILHPFTITLLDYLTPSRNLGNQIVNIEVGTEDNKALFTIHRKVLCSKIPFFDKMFNGGFEEAKTQCATLPEDDPSGFHLLVGWVYTGSIEAFEDELPHTSELG